MKAKHSTNDERQHAYHEHSDPKWHGTHGQGDLELQTTLVRTSYAVKIYSFSAGAIHLMGDYFLVLASPFALTYTASGYVCLPEVLIIVNVSNGEVLTRVTRFSWSGISGDLGPSLYMDYTSNNTIIYTQCQLGHCTTYLTTPKTLIKDQWYYLTNDTSYIALITILLITLAALFELIIRHNHSSELNDKVPRAK